MTTIIDPRYLQLRDALRASEDYRGLPLSQRQACQLFLTVMSDSNATEETLAQVYGPAVSEARRLMEKGVQLRLVLPDAAPTTAAPAAAPASVYAPAAVVETTTNDDAPVAPTSEQPAAVEQEQPVNAAAPVMETADAASDEPQAPEPPVASEPAPIVEPPPHHDPASDIPDHIGFSIEGLLRVRVADIKPNPINATVFSSSLGKESIRELADDIDRRKLQNPIQVRPDLVTPDGERRQLALMMLGVQETYVRVVHGIDTPEQVEDYVWDSYSAGRDAGLDERVKLYQLAQRVLQRRHGRPRGRPPGKSSSNDELFWSHGRVKEEAAKKAGFSSEVIADRAVSVFERADADLLAKLVEGEVTISAAYAKLGTPKPKPKPKPKPHDASEKGKGHVTAQPNPDETQPKQDDAQAQPHAAHPEQGEQQARHDDEQPEARAEHGDAADEQAEASSTSDQPENDTGPTTADTATAAHEQQPQQQTEEANAKATASDTATTEAKAPAQKLTVKQVIELAVRVAGKKPALVPEMIEREAVAANLTVIILDADPRRACDELARLLTNRLDDLAANDYEDACDLLKGIVENLWESANAHAPAEDAESVEDDSSEDDAAVEEELPKRKKAAGPMG